MQATLRISRSVCGHRGVRLAAALVPLPGLLAPAPAQAGTTVAMAICSGGGERTIPLPSREGPSRRSDDRQGCAHFLCPRERGPVDSTDDEEE